MTKTNQQGFLLISLIIVVAIVAILFAISLNGEKLQEGENGNTATSTSTNIIESGKQGTESLRESNQKTLDQQIEIQNELNSY